MQFAQQEAEASRRQVAELTEELTRAGEESRRALASQISLEEKIVEVGHPTEGKGRGEEAKSRGLMDRCGGWHVAEHTAQKPIGSCT